MPEDRRQEHEAMAAELSRIEEAATYSSQSQFSASKFWRAINVLLGVPAACLAAVAGAAALTEVADARIAGLIALVSAAMTAVLTTLNAAERAEQAHVAGNAYLALQASARVLRTVELRSLSYGDATTRLRQLAERRDEVNRSAPIPSFVAYRLGRRNITKGRQDYEVDR